MIKYVLFDAANTLIYKPAFYNEFISILKKQGYIINLSHFKYIHNIISETINFPDKTSKDFYFFFNKKILNSLGISPDEHLLGEIFNKCSYLPWVRYEDTDIIKEISQKKIIVSNFHDGLNNIIKDLFQCEFEGIYDSSTLKTKKPEEKFYTTIIKKINSNPKEILYIGDSIELDMEPAKKLGVDAWLIDRNQYYTNYPKRLNSLYEVVQYL